MKLIIHIGTEKTGTSTIQDVLYNNRTRMSEHGVHFLQSAGLRNNRAIPSACMDYGKVDDFTLKQELNGVAVREKYALGLKSKIHAELASLSEDIHTVVVSSEHFHSRTNTIKEISRVKDIFDGFFSEIYILCYFREQIDLAVSHFSTGIKSGMQISLENKLSNTCVVSNVYYNYYDMLSMWGSVFGSDRIIPRIFSKSNFHKGDFIFDFFNQIGPAFFVGDFSFSDKKNESLSQLGQVLGRAINSSVPTYVGEGKINPLWETLISKLKANFVGKGQVPSRDLYDKIYERFYGSNTLFNETFLGGRGVCFPYSPPSNDENAVLLNHDVLVNDISEIFSLFLLNSGTLSDRYADVFRDASLKLESIDLGLAYELMKISNQIRPKGQFISNKLKAMERKLKG